MSINTQQSKWIYYSLVASPFICLLIFALALLTDFMLMLGSGPSTDVGWVTSTVRWSGIAAAISILLLILTTIGGWLAYRKEKFKFSSFMSILILLAPIFFCVIGCLGSFMLSR